MFRTRYFIHLLFLCSFVLTSCTTKLPENIEEIVSKQFIFEDQNSQKIILNSVKNTSQLDSLLFSIKQKAPKGASYTELSDPANQKFTLGFSPPKDFNLKEKYPLIIYLHGGIGTTRTDKGKKAWNMFEFLQETENIFLASPSANRECPWWSSNGIERIMMSVRYMTLNYPIDPDKIFLAGVSDGGTACYAVANYTNSVFAGFFAISGLGAILQNFGIKLYPQNLMQQNIYNINASNDRLYPITYVNQFIESLESQGVNIEYKVYPNELHGFEYKIKEKENLLNFIKRWKRNNIPTVNHIFTKNTPYFNPYVNNIVLGDKKESYLNFYIEKDTLKVRSEGIKSFDLYMKNRNQLTLKHKNRINTLKNMNKNKQKITEKILIHNFYPGKYNKEIYHITLE